MNFQLIDRENWNRKPYFEHYLKLDCNYSVTANIEITTLLGHLRKKEVKFYPALIYIFSKTINALKAFRTCFRADGKLGYWEILNPSYTIFHQDDQTFSSIWTDYSDDFQIFYQNYLQDMDRFAGIKGLDVKENLPENTFHLSNVPWVSFTSLNLNIKHDSPYLLPILTCGKYFYENNRTLLPVSLQVHHGVCDGYHIGAFMEKVQQLADGVQNWMG